METRGFVLDPRGDLLLMLENPGSLFNGSQKVDRDQHGDAQSTPTAAVTHELAKLTTEPRFLYLVSSERLQRTSRYFRAALSGRWSVDVGPDGLKRMAASDWDPEALWNVLLVLHGRTVDLPMDMSLEMLAQVALIADYYGCEGAVSPIAVMWLGSKGDFLDDGADYEIAVLIFVSLVFGMQYEFSRATSIVMERRFEPISTNGLPIPEELIGEFPPCSTTESAPAYMTGRKDGKREGGSHEAHVQRPQDHVREAAQRRSRLHRLVPRQPD